MAAFGLIGADEPRYAQVAREMLARHDWITPTLGGKPWLEKPALYYWEAMLSYRIFGVSDWSARLPSAVDATLMQFTIYLFLRRFRSGTPISGAALDGALISASAAAVIAFARAASTDMPLAAMFTVSLLAWYAWYESSSRWYLAGFYIFLALGALAKGPIAPFLASAIILSFAVVRRDYGTIRKTLWPPGILLFCAIALPWYVAVQMKNPDFFKVFILEHNLARFGTNLYRHKEPIWYYAPATLLALVPWSVFATWALARNIRRLSLEKRSEFRSVDAFSAFCTIWLVLPIAFFSLSQSKLPGYILPAIPAGTLLLVEYFRESVARSSAVRRFLAVPHATLAGLLVVPALMIQYIVLQRRMPWGKAAAVSFAIAAVLAIAIILILRRHPRLHVLRLVTLVPVVIAVALLLRLGASGLDSSLSSRPLANEISRLESKPLPLVVFHVGRQTEYGLGFYRNAVIGRSESGEIPSGEFLLVAPENEQGEIERQLRGHRISYLGSFAPQKFDYYLASPLPNL